MPKIFESAGFNRPKYSAFDLSREQKVSMQMGKLVPTYLEEVVPGDNFRVQTQVLMRLAPMLAPVMHRCNVFIHYFFVPNRLLWNDWETFITGGRLGESTPTPPVLHYGNIEFRNSRLRDYLGLPDLSVSTPTLSVSALPFRAYQQIYSDYYRDPNLTDPINVKSLVHADSVILRDRAWEKDYFTSALPFTQRGPEVGVPVTLDMHWPAEAYTSAMGDAATGAVNFGTNSGKTVLRDSNNEPVQLKTYNESAVDFNINDLRTSSALQRWLEKSAVGGSRYVEQLLAFFGVKSDDARLQRAEYLGGGKQPIVFSEVLNTTGTANAPQGEMAGHGVSTGQTASFDYFVKEHGYIMGIMSVIPRTAYQQGIPKHYLRTSRFDYYFPEFARLGEQEVLNKEIYVANDNQNDNVFGYQQRYAEYKYGNSTVHGEFRTNLDFWHMGRKFLTRPSLNDTFMRANPTNRIFAVPGQDHLYVQMYHSVKARRPMPHFANPKLQ